MLAIIQKKMSDHTNIVISPNQDFTVDLLYSDYIENTVS